MQIDFYLPLLQRAAGFGVLVLLDFLTGVARALITQTFEWQKVANVLRNNALYFVGWLAVDFTTLVATALGLEPLVNEVAAWGALGLFAATIMRSILGNLSVILQSMNVVEPRAKG